MAKFRQALYIDFHAENSGIIKQDRRSWFYQKDQSLDRKYTIKMHSDNKRRQLFHQKIPFVRINFPYDGEPGRYKDEALNIHPLKSNYDIANDMMSLYLKNLEPNSVIYINAHGNKVAEYITQCVKIREKNDKLKFRITYSNLAKILNENISVYAKNKLQIKLIVCEPIYFAEMLMSTLSGLGFKNTSVIAYNATECDWGIFKNHKNEFNIKDIGTWESGRRNLFKPLINKAPLRHGSNLPDNKTAFHNHGGQLKQQPYREFKSQHMNHDDRIKNTIEGLSPAHEEVILLQNTLFQSMAHCLDRYEQLPHHGFQHLYGANGYSRVMHFCERINSISTESIINNDIDSEEHIKLILVEIISFANKSDGYQKFKGSIEVNDHSGMSFILRGFEKFCKLLEEPITSSTLSNFLQTMLDSNFKDDLPMMSQIFLDLQTKANRRYYLNQIKTIEI